LVSETFVIEVQVPATTERLKEMHGQRRFSGATRTEDDANELG